MKLRSKRRRILLVFSLLALHDWSMHSASALIIPRQPDSKLEMAPPPRLIRVRMVEAAQGIQVRGMDLRIYESTPNGERLVHAASRRTDWRVSCRDGRVELVPRQTNMQAALLLKGAVRIESPAGFLSVDGKLFRETLALEAGQKGVGCQLINELTLERYLQGLVNAEFSSKWNEEAVAAQVVAARTYALFQITQAELAGKRYHVESTIKDQVYVGPSDEDHLAARVVKKTAGRVLSAISGGKFSPIKAFYHSTCGGGTELPQRVWGVSYAGFKRLVRCPYCSSSPRYHWDLSLSAERIRELISEGVHSSGPPRGWPSSWKKLLAGAQLADVRLLGLDSNGRASTIETVWKGSLSSPAVTLAIPANQFRAWLGTTALRSTAFSVKGSRALATAGDSGRRFEFRGQGNGHGVGMCQWGAKVMAEQGHSAEAILKFYYPDANLTRIP